MKPTGLFLLVAAVAVAVLGNSISAAWAERGYRFSWLFYSMLVVSPLVFITFGLVAGRSGLAIAAGTVDALLTTTTIVVGLVVFGEWSKVSTLQYIGIGLSVVGVGLMVFFPRATP